jgi:hypothetical protein
MYAFLNKYKNFNNNYLTILNINQLAPLVLLKLNNTKLTTAPNQILQEIFLQ